jgi:hypothetical protein
MDHVGTAISTSWAEIRYEPGLSPRRRNNRDTLHRVFTARAVRVKRRRDRFHTEKLSATPDIAQSTFGLSQIRPLYVPKPATGR